MRKRMSLLMLCALLIFSLVGCSKASQTQNQVENQDPNQVVTKTVAKMDTVFTLKVYGPNGNKAVEKALTRIDELEQISSATIEGSDVSKINEAAGKEYVKVHPEIIEMLKAAVKYSELSDGAFDITVGPLIKLWGIGTDNARVPADEEIQSALPLVGYKNISINEKDSTVKLMKEGMSIELGGIAKGFTADEIISIFKKAGVKTALISLGGSSIYTLGTKPDGSQWAVGIQHPRLERNQGNLAVLKLDQTALSTSGDYERYFIYNDKRYHHILNPATGAPTDNGVMSVTIIVDPKIPNCNMLADILTKTVFVSGVEKGMKIIDSIPGVSSMAVTTDYKIYKSASWKPTLEFLDPDFTEVN